MSTTIKLRRDTSANWTFANPTLALGEPGLETDTRKIKYGDGSTAWTSLPYAASTYTLPTASTVTLGGVKVDGITISVSNGIISAINSAYSLPQATTSTLGGVTVDGTTITANNGAISTVSSNIRAVAAAMLTGGTQTGITYSYNSTTGLMTSIVTGGTGGGGITGLTVQDEGTQQGATAAITTMNFVGTGVTATVSGNRSTITIPGYTLPTATVGTSGSGTLGGVKVDGSTIVIANGVISSTVGYTLPIASTSVLGGVTIPQFNSGSSGSPNGINNNSGALSLATASTSQLGGVKVDGTSITINPTSGVISSTGSSTFTGGTISGATTFSSSTQFNGAITAVSTTSIIPFYFTNQAAFPNPTTYAGALAVSNADGRVYFANAGIWNGLVNLTENNSVTFNSGFTSNGTTTLNETTEVITTLTSISGTQVFDFTSGTIWYVTASGSFIANLINIPTTNNRSTVVTIMISQGSSAYVPSALQISGTAQTIKWFGGVAPSGNANKLDVFSFDLIYVNSTWVVTGALSTYG